MRNVFLYIIILFGLVCVGCASNKINPSLDSSLSDVASSLASKSTISMSDQYKKTGMYHGFFKENEQKFKKIFESNGDYRLIINKFRYEGNYPKGFQCFEPLLFVITIGIIPVICNNNVILEVDLVNTKTGIVTKESIKYKHNYVAGWAGLFMRLFKDWEYEDKSMLNAIYTVVNKVSEKKLIKSN